MYAMTPYKPIVPSTSVIAAAAVMSASVSERRAVDARTTSLILSTLNMGTVGSRPRTMRLTAATAAAGDPDAFTTSAIVRGVSDSTRESIGTA
jgi:hypothetical protein